VWWVGFGLVCGIIALANILSRNLTRSQEDTVLILGAIHWILGGVICYSFEAIRIETPTQEAPKPESPAKITLHEELEWHPASDFLQPGRRKRLLPR